MSAGVCHKALWIIPRFFSLASSVFSAYPCISEIFDLYCATDVKNFRSAPGTLVRPLVYTCLVQISRYALVVRHKIPYFELGILSVTVNVYCAIRRSRSGLCKCDPQITDLHLVCLCGAWNYRLHSLYTCAQQLMLINTFVDFVWFREFHVYTVFFRFSSTENIRYT